MKKIKTVFSVFAFQIIALIAVFLLQIDVCATEITLSDFEIVNEAGSNLSQLKDESTFTGVWLEAEKSITVTVGKNTKGIYFVWEDYPENGYIISSENNNDIEQKSGYLQEYISFQNDVSDEITITANSSGKVLEILPVGDGELPARVHNWQPPVEKADILLLPTHADDEHLFFGPIMPIYANKGNVAIQVAYMVNHDREPYRNQEMLNGLWTAGIRNYPIIPEFSDVLTLSLDHAKTIYPPEEIIDYQVELIERFEPQVIVAHDFAGEYGHGAHILNTECLTQSINIAKVRPKKVYVHLYKGNEITLEIDIPLEKFGGATAFDVVVSAFDHHKSQHQYYEVEHGGIYDMKKYGLYFSTVGLDSANDMLENIQPYSEIDKVKKIVVSIANIIETTINLIFLLDK